MDDLSGILAQFRVGPTEQEKLEAQRMALMHAGLGVLSANQPGPVPKSTLGVLAQGGIGGLGAYQGHLKNLMDERRMGGAAALQALQMKKMLEQQEALKGLFPPQGQEPAGPVQLAGPTPPGMSLGTSTAVFGSPEFATPNPQPAAPAPQAGGFQPIPVDRLAAAAASGLNIDPFIKLNNEARPDLHFQDAGGEIIVTDKKSMKVVQRIPKTAAPGSVPFEASDITAPAYRDFLLNKGKSGASTVVNNVNAFTPASETAQHEFMKGMRLSYDQLKSANTVLDNIERAKTLIPSASAFMGPGGEGQLEGVKFLNNRLGLNINTEGVKSAEELRSRTFVTIMDNLKKMDAQPSEMQQVMMRDALGKLGTDPNALPAVLDVYGDVVRSKVDQHNTEAQSAITRGVKFPYDPVIRLKSGSSVSPTLQNLLDKYAPLPPK